MDLASARARLYAVAPEAFVALRTDLAREARVAGDRAAATQIAALRRPSRSAWLVNLLARDAPEQLAELFALAPALAEMHTSGTPQQLRELTTLRRRAVSALVDRAVELGRCAGHKVSDQTRGEVQIALEAAMAHPQAAEQVLAGTLVKAPSSAAAFPLDLFEGSSRPTMKLVPAQVSPEPTPPEPEESATKEDAPVVDLAEVKRRREREQEQQRARRVAQLQARVEAARAVVADCEELVQRTVADRERAEGEREAAAAQQRRLGDEMASADERLARLRAELAELEARRAELVTNQEEAAARVFVQQEAIRRASDEVERAEAARLTAHCALARVRDELAVAGGGDEGEPAPPAP